MGNPLPPEEQAYRRGFDQGVAFVLMDLGLTNKQVQDLFYKKRVRWWRNYQFCYTLKTPDPAPRMREKEQDDIRELLLEVLTSIKLKETE